jgi:hypothetical protein
VAVSFLQPPHGVSEAKQLLHSRFSFRSGALPIYSSYMTTCSGHSPTAKISRSGVTAAACHGRACWPKPTALFWLVLEYLTGAVLSQFLSQPQIRTRLRGYLKKRHLTHLYYRKLEVPVVTCRRGQGCGPREQQRTTADRQRTRVDANGPRRTGR